jgi:hypothetical protein
MAWCEYEKVHRKMENIHGFQNILDHTKKNCLIGPVITKKPFQSSFPDYCHAQVVI